MRYEGQQKEVYLKALCQADMGDYGSLQKIILIGVNDVYKKEADLRLRLIREKSKKK